METQTQKIISCYAIPGLPKKGKITSKLIIRIVCNYLELSYTLAQSKYKKREYVKARQYSHYLAKHYQTGSSLQKIGDAIGGKDHATVLHSCKVVGYDLENYRKTREEINAIKYIIEKDYDYDNQKLHSNNQQQHHPHHRRQNAPNGEGSKAHNE
jgi:hypothetical protein